jgi:hypothetical protein
MIEIRPAPGNLIRTDGRTLKAEMRLRFPGVLVASQGTAGPALRRITSEVAGAQLLSLAIGAAAPAAILGITPPPQ